MEQHSDVRWQILDLAIKQATFTQLFTLFRSKKIEPVIIKGWAAARFYPTPHERSLGDIDLAVAPSEFPAAQKVLSDLKVFHGSVDLHCGLRDRDRLSWEDLFGRSYLVDVHGVGVRVLGDEDHLRLIAAHWLIDGGVNKIRLWDIYYMVQNRRSDFDWDLCLKTPNPNRKSWVLAAVATARDFLNLDVSALPAEFQKFKLPKWYARALKKEWARGPYLRIPIPNCITKPNLLFQQIHRRFPPNPIAATTDTEGLIDDTWRVPYQIKSIVKKLRNAAHSTRPPSAAE